jgi:serine/threonine-protein kinase SRPK3
VYAFVCVSRTNSRVALKIVKSAKNYLEAAEDEIKLLRKIAANDKDRSKCVVHMSDDFDHQGPNGRRKKQ